MDDKAKKGIEMAQKKTPANAQEMQKWIKEMQEQMKEKKKLIKQMQEQIQNQKDE